MVEVAEVNAVLDPPGVDVLGMWAAGRSSGSGSTVG
jgi:hypothetical protein